jgi:hypothetical protein
LPDPVGQTFSEKAKNLTPVKISAKSINSRMGNNKINPANGAPIFDPLIDQQCQQIYDSKEL